MSCESVHLLWGSSASQVQLVHSPWCFLSARKLASGPSVGISEANTRHEGTRDFFLCLFYHTAASVPEPMPCVCQAEVWCPVLKTRQNCMEVV